MLEIENKKIFAKINELNVIISKDIFRNLDSIPNNVKLLKIFNPNQLFLFKNEVYIISSVDIFDSRITINKYSIKPEKNNKSILIRKKYDNLDEALMNKLRNI